nr:MAG TPA: hypothetical protein [Caudoviricetes sp.]
MARIHGELCSDCSICILWWQEVCRIKLLQIGINWHK